MKTTEQRIEEIVKEYAPHSTNAEVALLDQQILRLELENLVIQAKSEQLIGEKE